MIIIEFKTGQKIKAGDREGIIGFVDINHVAVNWSDNQQEKQTVFQREKLKDLIINNNDYQFFGDED